jgi:hypothetical protein
VRPSYPGSIAFVSPESSSRELADAEIDVLFKESPTWLHLPHTSSDNMAFFNNAQAPYAAGPSAPSQPLQFFGAPSSGPGYAAYDASSSMGNSAAYGGGGGGASGNMNMQGRMALSEGKWWEAFGTGGFEGEPGLMEGELVLPLHRQYLR